MGLLILFASVSIGASFLCSIWEAVLLSIPPSYVHVKQQEGSVTGQLLSEFKRDIDRPLSAILSLNTIAHTLGAIGVGAVAAVAISHPNAEAIAGAVMTLLILILSEIIPKTIGATYWRALAPFTTRSLKVIIFLLYPLVWISQQITRMVKNNPHESIFSRADFTAMAEIGAKQGDLEESESRIIRNLLRFETVTVEDIMTPRTVVVAARDTTNLQEFYQKHREVPFSRIPVFGETRDHINGYILKDELLVNLVDGHTDKTLRDIMRDIIVVEQTMLLPELFSTLTEKQEHIAQVVDRFGGLGGIVTMEDLVETLLGLEIVDEMDSTVDMQKLARQNWEKRARRIGLLDEDAPSPKPNDPTLP